MSNNVENSEKALNKLLIEIVQNQKNTIQNLTRTCIAITICYTLLLVVMVTSYFTFQSTNESSEVIKPNSATVQNFDGFTSEIISPDINHIPKTDDKKKEEDDEIE